MPPPRKVDLIPEELRKWLKEALSSRGFGDIIAVTDELNFKLEAAGLQLNVGKTAVGEFSKLLKDQREAFGIAETLMADMDIDKESEIHKVLMHMIASMAMQLMKATREDDGHLPAKDLMALGKMLKDLMASAGIREKLLDDERQRIAREAREDAAKTAVKAAREAGLSAEGAQAIKAQILGVAA